MWKALLSCVRTQLIFTVLKQGLLLSLLTEKVTGAEQSVVGTLENRVLPSPGTTVIAAFPLGRRPSWALLFDPFLVVFMRTDCDRK